MSDWHETTPLENFRGQARLFPLPTLALFPHVIVPLHIFEERYRAMVRDALADDRLIAMAVLTPGWESDYEGRPPIHPLACLGRIHTFQELPGGRFNLLLQGLSRVRVVRELPPAHLFREAQVELLSDHYPANQGGERNELRRQLIELFRQQVVKATTGEPLTERLLSPEISLGAVTDVLAHTLDLAPALKEHLLSEPNVDCRAGILIDELQAAAHQAGPTANSDFPPPFSEN